MVLHIVAAAVYRRPMLKGPLMTLRAPVQCSDALRCIALSNVWHSGCCLTVEHSSNTQQML